MLIIIPTRMRRLMNDLTMRYCTNYSCFTLYWIGGAERLQHCPWKTMSDERSRRLATLRKRKQRDDDNNRSLEREYDRTRKRSAIQAETETDRRERLSKLRSNVKASRNNESELRRSKRLLKDREYTRSKRIFTQRIRTMEPHHNQS